MKINISLETKEKDINDAFERLLGHIRFLFKHNRGIELFPNTNIEITIEIKDIK